MGWIIFADILLVIAVALMLSVRVDIRVISDEFFVKVKRKRKRKRKNPRKIRISSKMLRIFRSIRQAPTLQIQSPLRKA